MFRQESWFSPVLPVVHHFIKVRSARIRVVNRELRQQCPGLFRELPHRLKGMKGIGSQAGNDGTQYDNPLTLDSFDRLGHLLSYRIPLFSSSLQSLLGE